MYAQSLHTNQKIPYARKDCLKCIDEYLNLIQHQLQLTPIIWTNWNLLRIILRFSTFINWAFFIYFAIVCFTYVFYLTLWQGFCTSYNNNPSEKITRFSTHTQYTDNIPLILLNSNWTKMFITINEFGFIFALHHFPQKDNYSISESRHKTSQVLPKLLSRPKILSLLHVKNTSCKLVLRNTLNILHNVGAYTSIFSVSFPSNN